MIKLISELEPFEYPYIVREISIDDQKNIVTIEFILTRINESAAIYYKQYPSYDVAYTSIKSFLSNLMMIEQEYLGDTTEEVNRSLKLVELRLWEDIVNDRIKLPDNSIGYVYKGDKKHIMRHIERIKKRLDLS